MAVTIKTIAEQVQLSNQAVSAVLNNKTNCRVSAKKREQILAVARELGYTSSISAQVMRGKATKTVAILCSAPYIQIDEHLTRITLDLMNLFNAAGYGCLYALASMKGEDNMKMVRELVTRGATAFVFLGEPVGWGKLEALINGFGYSFISYGNRHASRYVDSFIDCAMKEIIDYFIGCGYGRFSAIFHAHKHLNALYNAFPGMSKAEVEDKYLFKISILKPWNTDLDIYLNIGYEITGKLLKRKPDTQAIFYNSDIFALGGIRYLTEKGYRVGEDILVVGINNTLAVRSHILPISSIEHDVAKITDSLFREVFMDGECRIEVPMTACIRTATGYEYNKQNKG